MTRRSTLDEVLWPANSDDAQLAAAWAKSVTVQVLGWVWRGFDNLKEKHLCGVDMKLPYEQLERSLTHHHFLEILCLWQAETDGFPSVLPSHETPEFESLSSAQAKPPAYDLAFVHHENRRWKWPLEAKVLPTDGTLAEYMNDVREKFLAGVAAPLVAEGGMIAYLLVGSPVVFFEKVSAELKSRLTQVTAFRSRPHRSSTHSRKKVPKLRLHHLVAELT